MSEIYLGMSHLSFHNTEDHFIVVHDFSSTLDDTEGVVHVGEDGFEFWVAAHNSVDIDILILIAKLPTMVDWAEDVDLVNS